MKTFSFATVMHFETSKSIFFDASFTYVYECAPIIKNTEIDKSMNKLKKQIDS